LKDSQVKEIVLGLFYLWTKKYIYIKGMTNVSVIFVS